MTFNQQLRQQEQAEQQRQLQNKIKLYSLLAALVVFQNRLLFIFEIISQLNMEHLDLIVIGSGPAGEKGAAQAAYFNKRVAIIEQSPFVGGARTNTGALPSKTLRETALYFS